nr:hypothetical protein Iba_chr06eCG9300 [Ipomoea batatas]
MSKPSLSCLKPDRIYSPRPSRVHLFLTTCSPPYKLEQIRSSSTSSRVHLLVMSCILACNSKLTCDTIRTHRKEVAEQISSSMATKKIMPDQIKGEIPPTSSSWKTTYLQTNLSFPSFIALLFLKVDNSLARQYTLVLECKRNSEG